MPRDSNGNYTLAPGNPVVSGTTIESNWANVTLADIRQALTDSLDRYGRGGMQAAFRFADGTEAGPGISWTAEISTGFYRAGSADMRVSIAGVARMRWTSAGTDVWDGAAWVPLATGSGTWVPTTGGIFTGDVTISSAAPALIYTETDAAVDAKTWATIATSSVWGLETRGDTTGARVALAVTRSGIAVAGIIVGNATDYAPMTVYGDVRASSAAGTEDIRLTCSSTAGALGVTTGKDLALKIGTTERLKATAAGNLLGGNAAGLGGGVWYHADATLTGGRITASTSAAPATGTPGDIWLQVI